MNDSDRGGAVIVLAAVANSGPLHKRYAVEAAPISYHHLRRERERRDTQRDEVLEMNPNERPYLAPEKAKAIERLLQLLCPDKAEGLSAERPNSGNKDQVDCVKEWLRVVGDFKTALNVYKKGAYFDSDSRTRLRAKKLLMSADSFLTLGAIGRAAEGEELREAQDADVIQNERLDKKYQVIAPRIVDSQDDAVNQIVDWICYVQDYRAGGREKFGVDSEARFAALCTKVAEKLSRIPIGTPEQGPQYCRKFEPDHWEIQQQCTMFCHAAILRDELADQERIYVSIPLDGPLEEKSEGAEAARSCFSILAQVRRIVGVVRKERRKEIARAKASGGNTSKIPRVGSHSDLTLKRLDALPGLLKDYLKAARPVAKGKLTPNENIVRNASSQVPTEIPIPVDDVAAMMRDVQRRLEGRGVLRDMAYEAIRQVMDENYIPYPR